ncbi:MAG: carboxymuconolactone decarboxylase family protein, partial [Terriglobia bacterium]
QTIHGAIAAEHLGGNERLVADLKRDYNTAAVSDKLKALLAIAGKVQQGGKNVLPEDIERARREGATDLEIHDTVLIAAAFCMYNRYVDGLATWTPTDPEFYRTRGAKVAKEGYLQVSRELMSAKGGKTG